MTARRIAYGKIGRVVRLDSPSNVGGDVEVINLTRRLARAGYAVDLVTRHAGNLPDGVTSQLDPGGALADFPTLGAIDREAICDGRWTANVLRFEEVLRQAVDRLPRYDAWVIWLGEHNGPCWPYPKQDETGLVRPYGSRLNLVEPVRRLIEGLGVRPIWLCPDPRNLLRCNNLRADLTSTRPGRPIVAQYDLVETFARRVADDHRSSELAYAYGGLELLAVDHLKTDERDEMNAPSERAQFGALVNEGMKDDRPLARRNLVRPWLTDLGGELVGHWRAETTSAIGIAQPASVEVADVPATNRRWASTITLPASCTGWATAKPWEAFAAGTVCFAHPAYDDQDHVYGTLPEPVRRFLRPATPARLIERVRAVHANLDLRAQVVAAQRDALARARARWDGGLSLIRDLIEGATA